MIFRRNSQMLGGISENDVPMIVEIDGSYCFRCKYNIGKYRK